MHLFNRLIYITWYPIATGTQKHIITTIIVDRWGSELRARRLECKQRIETIETTIRQKNVLLTSLEAAAEQGDESYCLLLKKYESQIRELESKVIDLEREKSKLLAEHSNEELKEYVLHCVLFLWWEIRLINIRKSVQCNRSV